jgi:nickel/cobalt transporter (NicO) family protein
MFRIGVFLSLLLAPPTLVAHPMGNFSVNHYARLDVSSPVSTLTYVLDFAEIPTFELLQEWKLDHQDEPAIQSAAAQRAKDWIAALSLTLDGRQVAPRLRSVEAIVQSGAGGMAILRVAITAGLPLRSGKIEYEDRNYIGRAGWKEIVIFGGKGANILTQSAGSQDLSQGLTRYPADPSIAPPQDMTAALTWLSEPLPVNARRAPRSVALQQAAAAPRSDVTLQSPAIPSPHERRPPSELFAAQQPIAAGTVVKGDFLSRMLQHRQLSIWLILLGIGAAFGLGSAHALSPGHGKTIVAAYLVGSRGTLKHAALLGATVTATHTVTVFLLGLGVLCFESYIVPDRIMPWLGAVSGLSIVSVGLILLYQRSKALIGHPEHAHEHSHPHPHSHDHHTHPHPHTHPHAHQHPQGKHVHSHHGGPPHAHLPTGKITLGSLIALGVSGGLVPCPSALVLMLSAIALGRPGLGLILLLSFSAGLALVLMGIGAAVIYAKHLIPNRPGLTSHPLFRLAPVVSAVVVICLGFGMTAASLGWLQPGRLAL